jgi:hypothetical protein
MKKDLIFAPIMLIIGVMLFMLRLVGMEAHMGIAVIGLFVLAVYTAFTRREWKIPALEIVMRACYGIALVMGAVMMKGNSAPALAIAHKVSAALFLLLLVVLFITKLIPKKSK